IAGLDADELDVGAPREQSVVLERGTQAAQIHARGIVDEHDAVRVADAHRRDAQRLAVDVDRLADHLARWAGAGDVLAPEARRSHAQGDALDPAGAAAQATGHAPRRRFDREVVGRRATRLGEPAREDAQPVAALLGLAAVGVEDAEPRVGAG